MARTYIQNLAPFAIERRNLTNVIFGGAAAEVPPRTPAAALLTAPVPVPEAAAVEAPMVVEPVQPQEAAAEVAAVVPVAAVPVAAVPVSLLARERTVARKRAYGAQYKPCHPDLYTGALIGRALSDVRSKGEAWDHVRMHHVRMHACMHTSLAGHQTSSHACVHR